MSRISDINNRIEGHTILSDIEVSNDGITLGFYERRNHNPSKFKTLAIRKIKCEITENSGYPFALEVMYFDRGSGGSNKEAAFQCYNVETDCYYPSTAAADNPKATSIKLTPLSSKINSDKFYTSQFKLIPDRYISLISQFSNQPL
jgi:hypothetical protein